VQRIAALIRFDPALRDQYRLPWYGVLGLALLAGRVAVLLASGVLGSLAWLLLPVVTLVGSRGYYAWADDRRRGLMLSQFPDALALIVRAVRVGIPVPEAMRAVAREAPEPTRAAFDRLHKQIAIGSPLEIAVQDMARRNALPEYGFFAAALSLQAQTGGGLTETLETLADIIRRRIAMKERGHALSSEARTSSLVLAALPVATCGLMYATSPAYISLLFTSAAGNKLLGAAILSLAVGMGVMRLIIRKSLS
jgi:tight adherence protein B